ncbi:uncharacterized protein N7484_004106 [Penicillium longicatenatum]|uniref:uncharacterized protein n=1 Tax=Penicillium longicatenatum TaxID=1561947 RepID=UPI00254668A4|nr:uncharacterized protein N7484_004106 [Penicillium longicatenatum]KAJ5650383.1 hypothetical protein N7484_004106 [Penicillium longicatenatum]
MSTNGYTNCVEGTFYGFTDTANNEFYPGETLNLQWGSIEDGTLPLNISLGRSGGGLVDQIVVDATFSTSSTLYQIVTNTTANCTLEQYSWAIPSDFNTSNPQYQIGLFDGSAVRGDNNNGWRAWSPLFYIRDKSDAVSASITASVSGLLTATAETSPTATATSSSSTKSSTTSNASSQSSSNSTAIGVGVGVGVGVAALIALGLFWFFWRRRKYNALKQDHQDPSDAAELSGGARVELAGAIPMTDGKTTELPAQDHVMAYEAQEMEGGHQGAKVKHIHEME